MLGGSKVTRRSEVRLRSEGSPGKVSLGAKVTRGHRQRSAGQVRGHQISEVTSREVTPGDVRGQQGRSEVKPKRVDPGEVRGHHQRSEVTSGEV